ncbi:MAG TPA: phosphoenolpyruvate--protein phosphotransferase [Clostridiaceae bacterium]|nr:phosphoenolpyruvate--protein phosphotransferase [Clostridiaceae bacterium]
MKGIKASSGIAIGRAYLFLKDIEVKQHDVANRKSEGKRLDDAIKVSLNQLEEIRLKTIEDIDKKSSAIFEAHKMILEDPEFIPEIKSLILDKGYNAEYAVSCAVDKYSKIFNSMKDEYLKERGADIKDVGSRIIANLMGYTFDLKEIPSGSIIVAKDLTASDTASMDKTKIKAFLVDKGGRTSHTAIIARTLEMPAIVGLRDITSKVKTGDYLIVDGNEGEVIINPDADMLKLYNKKAEDYENYRKRLKELINLPAKSIDGKEVTLEANIGTPDDISAALTNGAEGIGLFRTEFLYMNRTSLPTEEEQFEAYKSVVSAMAGKRVTIRTLDVGGDKQLAYLGMDKEQNPFLGWRAIRFCLDREDIFRAQLRAILRASAYGKVSIMYPMISDIGEVRRANKVLKSVMEELDKQGISYDKKLEVGIMVEIPSAAMTADILAKEVDFFSIGTNDLTQYTLAVDRGNSRIKDYYNYFNPGVLRLVKNCIDQSHKYGIYTAMCGEMAGDVEATKILLGLGLDAFSMSSTSIPMVKDVVRNTTMEEAKALAKKALQI